MSLESRDSVVLADLIRPLSTEAIQYFADTRLEGPGWHPNDSHYFQLGKFVRLGSQIYLGSTVDYGPNYFSLKHWQIIEYAETQQESTQERQSAVTPPEDAGHFRILPVNGYRLVLDGLSADFGRADEDGRRLTIHIARSILADQVEVVGS